MKKVKLNESVLDMRLNAENRSRFVLVVLNDVFKARSDNIRAGVTVLSSRLRDHTWGKTPQARAANKRAAESLLASAEKLKSKGVEASVGVGTTDRDITLNLGGKSICLRFPEQYDEHPVIDFTSEYLTYQSRTPYENYRMGSTNLTLASDHPDAVEFWKLFDEATSIKDAADELKSILNTILGKSKTLRQAVDKWPELSQYVPTILSASREVVVRTPDLNAKLDALRSGKGDVKTAMKAVSKSK